MTPILSPSSLILACWILTGLIVSLTLTNIENFDLVSVFMAREGLNLSAFTLIGSIWICLSMLVYLLGDLVGRLSARNQVQIFAKHDLDLAAVIVFWVNFILIFVTCLWIAMSAVKIGGLMKLVTLTYLDATGARDVLLGTKLFTGMRLFYAALPATGCLAAAILAMRFSYPLSVKARVLCIFTLSINVVALFILPMVMSQRLLLFQLLISSYLVTCILRGRVTGLRWLALATLLFLTTWILRESITNAFFERSALDIGIQKLAFYYVNDLWNGFAPLLSDIPHTFGGVSLRGFMFLTLTDGMFSQVLQPKTDQLDQVLGGGDFPFFTAAYVDFGPIFGAFFIGFCAFVFRLIFNKAHHSLIWACQYAQLGAALLFSTHGIYFTHQNFLFSIALIWAIHFLVQRISKREPALFLSSINA
ncbi:MAG: O-antigen polymerase [Lentilitoribacter sp.]